MTEASTRKRNTGRRYTHRVLVDLTFNTMCYTSLAVSTLTKLLGDKEALRRAEEEAATELDSPSILVGHGKPVGFLSSIQTMRRRDREDIRNLLMVVRDMRGSAVPPALREIARRWDIDPVTLEGPKDLRKRKEPTT